jgi:hypothetical protein
MPEGQSSPECGEQLGKLDWSKLLQDALTLPGSMGNVYNRFYRYSFLNTLLLQLQGVQEPVNTYNRWRDMGRQVKKGKGQKHPPAAVGQRHERRWRRSAGAQGLQVCEVPVHAE